MALSNGNQVTITDFRGQAYRYTVVQPLGDGYLADVYLVRDVLDNSPVVVKVLKQRHIDAENKASDFLREADFLQQFAHRREVVQLRPPGKGNIVLESGIHLPCVVQEYVGDRYRSAPDLVEAGLDERTGLEICRQFTSLLGYLHSRGIIYTDLKSEHIFWDGTSIKVIDWNVVRDFSTADRETFRAAVEKQITTLGQIMYYLFTGRASLERVEGPTVTTLALSGLVGSPLNFEMSATGGDLSVGTKIIIERILQEAVNGGYASMSALEQDLTQHVQRLRRSGEEPVNQTRASISKGLAAMEAGDYEDAVVYFEDAVHYTPGLVTQSHLIAARIRLDTRVSSQAKDPVEGNLALFRMSLQEGDLTTALDALVSCQEALPDYKDLDILHQLATQLVETVTQAEEALAAADYATAQQALRRAKTVEPSVEFIRERLHVVEMFDTHRQAGEQALRAGQFAEAAAAFEALLDHMPQSEAIEQHWLMSKQGEARSALERKAYAEARRAFEAILERQPRNKEAQAGLVAIEEGQQRLQQIESWLSKGRMAFHTADYDRALQCINEVLDLEPEHDGARQLLADVREAQQTRLARRVRRWLEKGRQLMAQGEYEEAISYFERASSLDPDGEADALRARAEATRARNERFQALLHKAHAAFRGQDYDTAIRYFEEAIDISPGTVDARRGLTLARQRQVEVRAQEAQNLLARGRAALSAGEYEEALQHFERASELDSAAEIAAYIEKTFRIRDLVHSAEAAEARGDLREAIQSYARAVETEPLPGLEQRLAEIRARAHTVNQEQVQRLIERAITHLDDAPEQAVTWLKQAQALHSAHDDKVAELLRKAEESLRHRDMHLRHLLDTGEAALHAGDGTTSERAFAEALMLDPDHAEALAGHQQAQQFQDHLRTARRAGQDGDYEAVIAHLTRAVELAPRSVKLQQELQQAQCDRLLQQARQVADAGDYAQAQHFIAEALNLDPNYVAAHEVPGQIHREAEATRQAQEAAAQQAILGQVQSLLETAGSRLEAHDYDAAITAIDSALEIMPDNLELINWRREITQEKALDDRARLLMHQGRRFERHGQLAEAVEAYEIAARLTPDPAFEAEVRARAEQAQRNQRRQRLQNLIRRIVGISDPIRKSLGED